MAQTLFLFAVGHWHWARLRSRGRVKQRDDEADAPIWSVARAIGIISSADPNTNRLLADLEDLAQLEVERDRPLSIARRVVPVCSGFRVQRKGGMRLGRVRQKRLEKHLAETAPVFLGCDGPELIHECAHGPSTHLLQYYQRGSDRECASAEKVLGAGRIEKHRAETPDNAERTRFLRRKEKALSRVAKTILGTIRCRESQMLWDIFDIEKIVLRYDRQDRAQNQIPIFADGDRNDWLNVEGELVAVMRRSIAKVFVRLKRDADQRRNGIRQLFGELVCLIRVRFDLGSIGGVEPANR